MKFHSVALPVLACCSLLGACTSEDPGGSGSGTDTDGSTGMDVTSSTTGTSTSTTAASDSAEGSSSSSTTADAESSSSTGNSEVFLGGRARDFLGGSQIVGAQLSMFGDPSLTAVTDKDGAFSLGPLEPDAPVAIVAAPSEADEDAGIPAYVGAIIPERTGLEDRDDADVSQIQVDTITAQIDLLESQEPAEPDLDQAIVIVLVNPFAGGSAVQDGIITVTMTPDPVEGTYYAADAEGGQVLNSTEIGYEIVPAAVFFNLPDAELGDISVTVEHEMADKWACDIPNPVWPTLGGHTTLVLVECECQMDCG